MAHPTSSPAQNHLQHPTSPPDKETNAQRLRENQRRSRQRKKEYLASLESRHRDCQRAGIEASVEVQTAAKRVVRENHSLRELLRVKGVPGSEIEAWVRERVNRGLEGIDDGVSPVDDALKALAKRPCSNGPQNSSRRKSSSATSIDQGHCDDSQMVYTSEESVQQYQETCSPSSSQSPPSSRHSAISTPIPRSPTVPMSPPYQPSAPPVSPTQRIKFSNSPPPSVFPASPPVYMAHIQQQQQQAPQDLFSFHSPHVSSPIQNTNSSMYPNSYILQHHQPQQHYVSASRNNLHSSMSCDMARAMMEEMSDGMDHGLTRQICPQGLSQGCMIDTNDLFGVMDRRI